MKRLLLIGTVIAMNVLAVISIGGALDIPAALGVAYPMELSYRSVAGMLGVATFLLAFRIWVRIFDIEPSAPFKD